MLHRRLFLSTAAGLCLLAALPAAASARTADGDRAFLSALVGTHIRPRVDALAAAATDAVGRIDRFCAAPDTAGLAAAREGYVAVMDRWAGAQHLRPGPLLLEMRSDRIAFWPERRGIVARQLGQLLASRDPKVLEPGALARQSAAVQGLTALERLLFDDGTDAAKFTGDEAGAYRCALTRAVARNVAALSGEVRDGWAALAPALAAGEPTPVGTNATEAVTNLYLSLVTAMQIVVDLKILIPLGPTIGEAKPTLAESVRAGRSLRNIALNLAGMQGMMEGENGGPGYLSLLPATDDGAEAKRATTAAFAGAHHAVTEITTTLDRAVVDPATRPRVEALFRTAKMAQTAATRTLPPLLDITLGFNELDGD